MCTQIGSLQAKMFKEFKLHPLKPVPAYPWAWWLRETFGVYSWVDVNYVEKRKSHRDQFF